MSLKIIHIIPGSGGNFYCGNCLRDSKYFDTLRKLGHDVIKVPMYLPIFSDEHDLDNVPVFYGAISIYLKQLYPFFRRVPGWVDKFLNSKMMLKMAASMAGSTRANGLEEMTISMLLGEKGNQREELEKMTDWMKDHFKPDIVHLSNALLLGLAGNIKEKLNVPVVCSLQDEDVWVDIMSDPNRTAIWKLMSDNARFVDRFIAVSDYYADFSARKMNLPGEKIISLPIGVNPADYNYINSADKARTIGYISRMCHENGLDILVDAFILLKGKPGFEDVKLIVTGGQTRDDLKYLRDIRRRLNRSGLLEQVNFHKEFEGSGRKEFFNTCSVISVPVRNGEAFGIYIAESMASGIPVVQPALGGFPEIVEKTGGGIIYQENTPETLADALMNILSDSTRLRSLSETARAGAVQKLDISKIALDMVEIYKKEISS